MTQIATALETQQAIFVSAYANSGSMLKAREASGLSAPQLKRWLADADTDFALQIEQARDDFVSILETEAFRRAVEGVEKAIYHKGELVAHETVYSDTLLVKLLEGNSPKYSKKVEVAHTGGFSVEITQFSTIDSAAIDVVEDVTPKEPQLW
jgi:hypothetical protein